MLLHHPYVHLISLDFSKAFDTVRHSTLISKLADFPLPNFIHNWVVAYLADRQHCTKFDHVISNVATINASIVQGSGLGPINYVINASDLHPINISNRIVKYADDTYLLVPSNNSASIPQELTHISEWALTNNLKLNPNKSSEMMFENHVKPKILKSRCNRT